MDLRYGMNPHQSARVVPSVDSPVRVIHGARSMINEHARIKEKDRGS